MSDAAAAGWTITRGPLPPLDSLAARWQALEQRSSASFYLRWHWIGAWLAAQPSVADLELVSARRRGAAAVEVALAIVGRRRVRQPGGLALDTLHLHATGDLHWDRVAIEHNGWLMDRHEDEAALQAALSAALLPPESSAPQALVLPGLRSVPAPPPGVVQASLETRPAWIVDLKALRRSGQDYLASLPSRSRRTVRKAVEGLQGPQALTLVPARGVPQALAFLEALMQLHQHHWTARGQPGAFAHEGLRQLHRQVVREGCADGSVVLLALLQGARPLAYLLYHCHGGWAHFYQSGVDYDPLPEGASPGLAAHALAIEHFLAAGHEVYDFMAGDLQYKRTMASGQLPLHWVQWQRDVARTRLARWVHARGRHARQLWRQGSAALGTVAARLRSQRA